MKPLTFAFYVCVSLVISGCNTQSLVVPDTDNSVVVVSHVKEEKITFVDMEENTVLVSEESHFPITEMLNIGDNLILASSQSAHSLLLYDLKNGRVSPFLKLNQGLTALAYDLETDALFVTDILNDKVHLIDTNRKELIQSIEVAPYPTHIELGNNELFVLSGKHNQVTVTDIELRKIFRTFPVLERPSGMYFDGDKLWIGGHGSVGELNKSIVAYDPDTGNMMNEVSVGVMPIDFFGDPYEPYFYVLCHGNHGLYKINKDTSMVEDAIEVGQNPNFITGNEKSIFVTNLDGNSLSIIDREAFKVVDEVTVAAGPYAIVLLEE